MAYDFIGSAHDLVRKLRASLGLAPAPFGPPCGQLLGRPGYGDQAAKVPAAVAAERTEQ
jgi:hypothetical protein